MMTASVADKLGVDKDSTNISRDSASSRRGEDQYIKQNPTALQATELWCGTVRWEDTEDQVKPTE